MIGWGIALAVLAAIWFFPVGVLAHYDEDGPQVKLILSVLHLQVYPRRNPVRKKKPKQQKNPQKKAAPAQEAPQKTGGSLKDFLPLLRQVLDMLVDFRDMLRVNRLELQVVLAGGEPDTLAANYGRAWAALGALDATLEDLFYIKKKKLDIQCDFCGSQSTASGHLELTITIGRLLRLSIRHGRRILPVLLRLQNMRKGGATQ